MSRLYTNPVVTKEPRYLFLTVVLIIPLLLSLPFPLILPPPQYFIVVVVVFVLELVTGSLVFAFQDEISTGFRTGLANGLQHARNVTTDTDPVLETWHRLQQSFEVGINH